MKKLLILVCLVASLLPVTRAATSSATITSGKNIALQGPFRLNSLQMVNATTNDILVYLYDAPTNVTTFVRAQYTNTVISAPSLQVTTYTNVFGTVEHWTNLAVNSTLTTVAAITNNYSIVGIFPISASSTSTLTPTSPLFNAYGLLISNSATITYTLNYSK